MLGQVSSGYFSVSDNVKLCQAMSGWVRLCMLLQVISSFVKLCQF